MQSETHSELIPGSEKSNSNHVNNGKKKKNGQILNFRRKNGGIIRPTGIFFETFWANSSDGFEGLETFFGKKKTSLSLFHFL